MGLPAAKTCIFCGVDCAGKPRVKDERGRYACKACAEKRQAAALLGALDAPVDAADLLAEPALGDLAEPAYALVPEDRSSGADRAAVAGVHPANGSNPASGSAARRCSNCGSGLDPADVLCVKCGRMLESGRPVETKKARALAAKPTREQQKARDAAAQAQRDVIVPIVLFVVGVGLHVATFPVPAGRAREEVIAAIVIAVLAQAVVGSIAYLLCCFLWIGQGAGVGMSFLRMLGCVALAGAVGALLPGLAGLLASVIVCGMLMAWLMEEDPQDMFIAAAICYALPWILLPLLIVIT